MYCLFHYTKGNERTNYRFYISCKRHQMSKRKQLGCAWFSDSICDNLGGKEVEERTSVII